MTKSNTDRIEKRIELHAPVARVWRALTDYKEFGAWFRVNLQSPFIPGKITRGNITNPGYEHLIMEVVVQKMEPQRLFSFHWHPYAIDPKAVRRVRGDARVFAALGDPTRLALVATLSRGSRFSIARLAESSPLTRQAITKHLRVLQHAGLDRGVRRGRENLFELDPKQLDEAQRALHIISRQWDAALQRLKSFVEE